MSLLDASVTRVLWDWNGTLLDDVDLVVRLVNGLLRQRGLPGLDADRHRESFAFPVRRYYERLGFRFEPGEFAVLAERYTREYDEAARSCPLRSGAIELLDELASRELAQSILSAARSRTIRDLIEHRGLARFFDDVVGRDDDLGEGKGELAQRWLTSRRLDPRGILLVGDTLHDADVARHLGVRCVLIAGGHQSEKRLASSGFPVLPSLDALLDPQ